MILEEGIDAGLTWHYGSPVAEARTMAAGGGIVALTNRDVVEISGDDRLTLLQLISSARFDALAPGETVTALILDAQGHIAHAFTGVDDGARLVAWTEPGGGEPLVAHLMRMRFAMRVEARVLERRLYWVGEQMELRGVSCACALGGRWLVTESELAADVGTWAWEAARIAGGIPRIGVDTDARTIPNEIGLYGTALDKGCYPGQETVAKVFNLGRPPRRLVRLHLDGSMVTLPEVGGDLWLGERKVGFVGASALHHELGPIALGLVQRAVAVDAELTVAGIPAAQEPLVDPNVGLHVRPTLG